MKYLIWWLNQEDCEAVYRKYHMSELHLVLQNYVDSDKIALLASEIRAEFEGASRMSFYDADFPKYISREISSRYGRSGRGRLWVPRHIDLDEIQWNEGSPAVEYCHDAGGIVFDAHDLKHVINKPGIVTDINMMPVINNPDESED